MCCTWSQEFVFSKSKRKYLFWVDRSQYAENTLCPLCERFEDTQEHVGCCQVLLDIKLKKNQGHTNKYMGVFSNKKSSQIYTYSCSNFVTSCWKEGQTRAPVYQSTLVQCALRLLPSRVQPGGVAGLQPFVVYYGINLSYLRCGPLV